MSCVQEKLHLNPKLMKIKHTIKYWKSKLIFQYFFPKKLLISLEKSWIGILKKEWAYRMLRIINGWENTRTNLVVWSQRKYGISGWDLQNDFYFNLLVLLFFVKNKGPSSQSSSFEKRESNKMLHFPKKNKKHNLFIFQIVNYFESMNHSLGRP